MRSCGLRGGGRRARARYAGSGVVPPASMCAATIPGVAILCASRSASADSRSARESKKRVTSVVIALLAPGALGDGYLEVERAPAPQSTQAHRRARLHQSDAAEHVLRSARTRPIDAQQQIPRQQSRLLRRPVAIEIGDHDAALRESQ